MASVDKKAAEMFHNGVEGRVSSNTEVVREGNTIYLELHGNRIAKHIIPSGEKFWRISHSSKTTNNRLNAIGERYGLHLFVKNGVQHFSRNQHTLDLLPSEYDQWMRIA